MDTISIIKWSLYMFIFLAGLYFYTNSVSDHSNMTEGMQSKIGGPRCPNVLIQKGAKYYLFNSDLAQVPGVNPIAFNNLEEYTEFLEWQRGAGIRCPVLYLQNTYDAQGERVYKIRPSVSEPQGGLSPMIPQSQAQATASMITHSPPYNSEYSSADINMHENMLHEENEISDNQMDTHWGGAEFTEKLVQAGYYKDNEVNKLV